MVKEQEWLLIEMGSWRILFSFKIFFTRLLNVSERIPDLHSLVTAINVFRCSLANSMFGGGGKCITSEILPVLHIPDCISRIYALSALVFRCGCCLLAWIVRLQIAFGLMDLGSRHAPGVLFITVFRALNAAFCSASLRDGPLASARSRPWMLTWHLKRSGSPC